ncbi:hypothetical protein D3C76_1181670 [compost metagenome]
MHRVGFFAGTPAPTGTAQASGLCSTCRGNCIAKHLNASAITVGAGMPANTGEAGARYRVACFAGEPAHTSYLALCGALQQPCSNPSACAKMPAHAPGSSLDEQTRSNGAGRVAQDDRLGRAGGRRALDGSPHCRAVRRLTHAGAHGVSYPRAGRPAGAFWRPGFSGALGQRR